MVNAFWQDSLNNFTRSEKVTKDNSKIVEALLILCVFVVNHVKNITQKNIETCVEEMKIEWYDIWKAVSILLHFDRNAPMAIKTYLFEVESWIVNEVLWKNKCFVEYFI